MKAYNKTLHFGENIIIKYSNNFTIGHGSTYNDCCYFNARFGIQIGENTLIGPLVVIQTSNHIIKNIGIEQNANDENSWCAAHSQDRVEGEKIVIGNDVWIGASSVLLPGTNIPDKCVIGAGTILTKKNSSMLERGDIVVNNISLKVIGNRRDYD